MGSYDNAAGYSLGDNYIDPSDEGARHLKQLMDNFYQYSYPQNAAYWQQGAIDKRFLAGDQALLSLVYGENNYNRSRRFYFNLIRRQLNMITGYQRRNRKSTVALPQFQNDSLADDYNGVLKWTEERDGFQEYLSEAFANSCATGMSLLHLYMDYTLDPVSGDLFTDQVGSNFLIDPYFRKMDLTDCRGIWRRRWVSKENAMALLPGRAEEIKKMRPGGVKDGRFPLQAELLNMAVNRLYAYDEFHYRTQREARIIIDPKSEEAILWEEEEGEDNEDELKRIMQAQPWLRVKKVQVPTVKLVIAIGDKVMYHGPNLLNIDSYPFVPSLCYYDPDIQNYSWRCQGVIRNLRDVQYLFNMRKVIEMDILQSQVNSGWIYPVDAVVDPKAFRQSGQGYLIPLKAGRLPNEIQRIEAAALPQSLLELSRGLAEDMPRISGVNEELLGAADDQQAGILSMLRQSAGLTTLQPIFDKLDYTQRLYGKLRLQAIRKNFSRSKIASILNKEPDERFFSSNSLKYALTVEEGNYSTTQRQMELQQLLHFKQIGMNVADKTIWRAAFLTNKAEAEKDAEEAAQQQMQQQQAQTESQNELNQSKIMQSYAKARSDLALEEERRASAQEKIAKMSDIQADAERKEMEADLGLVKMMLELENMDLEQIHRSYEMAKAIKAANEPQPTIA